MTHYAEKEETSENKSNLKENFFSYHKNPTTFTRYRENSIWAETTKTWEDCPSEKVEAPIANIKDDKETPKLYQEVTPVILENRRVENSFVSKLMESAVKEYLIIFESGRTLIGLSREELSPETYVVIEADRGEDVGKIYAVEGGIKNIFEDSMLNLTNYYSGYKYKSTRNYFLCNHLYAEKKKILREALPEEVKLLGMRQQQEQMALDYINHIKDVYYVDMEITKCEYQWDCKRITFYYRSSRRIDFRELVKELFKHFKIRIWMCSENREFYK